MQYFFYYYYFFLFTIQFKCGTLLTIQNFTYLQYLHHLQYEVLTTYDTVTNCTPITLLTITNCTLITLLTITK